MAVSLVALAAALSLVQVDGLSMRSDADRPLATRRPYPAGRADDVRRPGFNGLLWQSLPIIGGVQGPYAIDRGEPGPLAYGASQWDFSTVYARVDQLIVGVDPWERLPEGGLSRLEDARNLWLKERGYTGGVRTFVNDLYLPQAGVQLASITGITPTPRATIQLAPDAPRVQRRMRVQAGSGVGAITLLSDTPGRISWPDSAPSHLKGRTALLARGGRASPVQVARTGE
jgi:hypothetical protein